VSRTLLARPFSGLPWADLIGELAAAVLHAPDLARHEVLTVLTDLDHGFLRELIDHLAPEEGDTDEFPVQPDRESG
jgi:hypothetical protein